MGARPVTVNLLHHSREASFYLPGLGIVPWVNMFEPPACSVGLHSLPSARMALLLLTR